MNNKTLPIGFVVSIFLNIIASVFKIEHLPGSKSLIILGLLSYGVLAILCLYEIVNSKKVKRSEKINVVRWIPLYISCCSINLYAVRKKQNHQ